MSLKFTILGCGNSSGVPATGNDWGACDPYEPRNRRSRCALSVQNQTTTLIIDTGPDFREQLNRENITAQDISAILYTHSHGDHVHGIDDLRAVYFQNGKKRIDIYGKKCAISEITQRFYYLFEEGNNDDFYDPLLNANIIEDYAFGKEMKIADITFIPFEMDHGSCLTTGYRFGDLSYCVDMKRLDHKALDILQGSKIWIVDAAGFNNPNHDVHADLETVYKYNEQIKAETVYITSLSTQMDYKTLQAELPEGFAPAHDGLVIHRP